MKALQNGLDASFNEFTRTASQAKAFVDEAAGLLAARFEGCPPEQLSARIGVEFAKVDLDGNGVLDRDEIKAAFSGLMGRRLSDDDVNLMLDMFHHEQGNEEVDTVEFEHLVRYHLFVPCTDTCYVCDPSKRAVVGAQTRRPLSAQQQRCKNFSVCGFQGPVRIVGTQ